jgi:hypothetical protein
VLALSSITLQGVTHQHQADGVLLYLAKHGQHVDSVNINGPHEQIVSLRQMPPTLQPSSLQFSNLQLQMLPGDGFQGVLGNSMQVAALKQLRLQKCTVIDNKVRETLAAALCLLPAGLEDLSINTIFNERGWGVEAAFPITIVQRLQQLTYLELRFDGLNDRGDASYTQFLKPLARLVDLRLTSNVSEPEHYLNSLTANMLRSTRALTRLELTCCSINANGLDGKTQLQHLTLEWCSIFGRAAGVAKLLLNMVPLKQLAHLSLADSLRVHHGDASVDSGDEEDVLRDTDDKIYPPARAYADLTASSKLKYLDISNCLLPEGAWQHIFHADKHLPDLHTLNIASVEQPSANGSARAPVPDCSHLVRCCPGLKDLDLSYLLYRPELLVPLQGLSGLEVLAMAAQASEADGLQEACQEAVCQLTRLKRLWLCLSPSVVREGLLLPLTQLKQLTSLVFLGPDDAPKDPDKDEEDFSEQGYISLRCEVSLIQLHCTVAHALLAVAVSQPVVHTFCAIVSL